MADNRLKIGILASKDRYPLLTQILRAEGFVADPGEEAPAHVPAFPLRPEWKKILSAWDKAGVDVALVDDESFPDKEAMVSGMRYYLATTRMSAGSMGLVFVADGRRQADDQVFSRLGAVGLRDVVRPGGEESVATQLRRVLERLAPPDGEAAQPVADGRAAPPGGGRSDGGGETRRAASTVAAAATAGRSPSLREQMTFAARGKSIIAVAGIMPRSGATNCSIVLARTLSMLDQAPALIVDDRAGSGFRKGYARAMAPDGKSFRINGVDIFPEAVPADIPRKYSHVVLDMGFVNWGSAGLTPEEQDRLLQFNKADLQVVYLPCASPADFEHLNRFFESRSAADLERYAIGVWGATDELFEMIRAKFREKAPEVFMWNVAVYRWPLSLGRVDRDMVEVLRPVLPRGVYTRALKACASRED